MKVELLPSNNMPLTATCIARYRADAGVFSDAGVTPAAAGDRVYQWNDLTGNGHHLSQTAMAARPLYSSAAAGESSVHPAINFDGSLTFLNLPTSLNLPGAGCAVLVCSRGSGASIVTLGTSTSITYGFAAGPPGAMALMDSTIYPFPEQTYLPTITPIVHGFRCTPAITRLSMGTRQTSDLAYDTSAFSSNGGKLGSQFRGDIFELAIFSPAPDDSTLEQLMVNLRDSNGISYAANTTQIIFIGDSNIGSIPALICATNGDLFKPLVLAQPNHTIADQQAVVDAQLPTLDLDPFDQTIAVVAVGTNDFNNGRTAAQILADLSRLCSTLRALQIKVMVATLPDPAMSAVNAILQSSYATFADVLVNWAADSRLVDSTNTELANDGLKAAILQPALQLLLKPPPPVYELNYASFYSAGQTFTGSFGHFVQS